MSGRVAPPIAISLDQVIPPIVPEADTKYVRHIRIESALLTKFWGTPTVSECDCAGAGGI